VPGFFLICAWIFPNMCLDLIMVIISGTRKAGRLNIAIHVMYFSSGMNPS